ncbi:MAG: hypothetical protein CSA58_08985 [Micrococcales bacterium]|nr:MAG: hypothetical protein CSA58_08985 [Micrococcales bacterium]
MVTTARHAVSEGPASPADETYPYPRDEFDVDEWEGPRGAHRAARKGWYTALPWLAGIAAGLLVMLVAFSFLNRGGDEGTQTAADPVTTSQPAAGAGAEAGGAATEAGAPVSTAAAAEAAETGAAASAAAPSEAATASAGEATDGAADATAVDKSLDVQILNATRIQGLAARTSQKLKADGWTIVAEETYRESKPPTTVYYRDTAQQATAQELAKQVGGVPVTQSQSFQTPITLMLGADFKQL